MYDENVGPTSMLFGAANFGFNFIYELQRDAVTDARMARIESKLDYIIRHLDGGDLNDGNAARALERDL